MRDDTVVMGGERIGKNLYRLAITLMFSSSSFICEDLARGIKLWFPQPSLSWRASTLRQMALAGTPATSNKSSSVIRQYGPIFVTAHDVIQYDCGGGFPKFIYSVLLIINMKLRILYYFLYFFFLFINFFFINFLP